MNGLPLETALAIVRDIVGPERWSLCYDEHRYSRRAVHISGAVVFGVRYLVGNRHNWYAVANSFGFRPPTLKSRVVMFIRSTTPEERDDWRHILDNRVKNLERLELEARWVHHTLERDHEGGH